MGLIYHITTREAWDAAEESGFYQAASLKEEGFIHCSEASQVEGVLHRYYAGKKNLVKLFLDTALITSPLKYEMAPSVNELFPHVYGRINIDAVIAVEAIN